MGTLIFTFVVFGLGCWWSATARSRRRRLRMLAATLPGPLLSIRRKVLRVRANPPEDDT